MEGTFMIFKEHLMVNRRKCYKKAGKLDSQLRLLSKEEFLALVYQYANSLKIKHSFDKTGMKAGKHFYYSFIPRLADLRLRSAESTSLQRIAGFNEELVDRFFSKLNEFMEHFSFCLSKIVNVVISIKGRKQVCKPTSVERVGMSHFVYQ